MHDQYQHFESWTDLEFPLSDMHTVPVILLYIHTCDCRSQLEGLHDMQHII